MKKSPQKKDAAKPKAFWSENKTVLALIFIAAGCLVGAIGWTIHAKESSARIWPPETTETEMHTIPDEVKNATGSASPSASFRVPILMYHYIEFVADKGDRLRQALDVIPPVLASQIQTLQGAGYTFMTASELADVLDGKSQLPQKPVLLTFDDGHRDFYTNALPVLERYHVKATSYVISGFLGGSDFMTPEQVQAISKTGLVEVGAHTVDHLSLKGRTLTQIEYQVDTSKTSLENLIHAPVVSFAYPYGTFDNQTIQIIKDAGFRTALSTIPGIEQSNQNRYYLFRLRPGYRTGAVLLNWLSQSKFSAF